MNNYPNAIFSDHSIAAEKKIAFLNKLLAVEQPARYVGGERGTAKKDLNQVSVRVALCYPDLYEIGMSNQGLAILYHEINKGANYFAERVYSPWPDMERLLLDEDFPLYTLETMTPLSVMDVVGFNLNHELLFSNALNILSLAKIPLQSSGREEQHPLVIFGGSAAVNPAPLAAFGDCFFIGDGDEAILEICAVVEKAKKTNQTRQHILIELAGIEGLFVPSLYNQTNSSQPKPIQRRHLSQRQVTLLDHQIVANKKITQERLVVEVARGCGRGCRFCQAGFIKRPLRYFKPISAQQIVEKTIDYGWQDISLSSLSLTDYPYLETMVSDLVELAGPLGLSLNLPSLRIDPQILPLLTATGENRRSSLTFALESGSAYIRRLIRKEIDEINLYPMVYTLFRRGWDTIKIYFMLGLPNFGQEDEAGEIIRVLNNLSTLASAIGSRKQINVTLSPFVPKPHTPFQWMGMKGAEYFIEQTQRIIQEVPRRVSIKRQDTRLSTLEAALARGDEQIGQVLLSAYQAGARFDGWQEHFDFNLWQQAFRQHGLELDEYAGRYLSTDQVLPWSMINAAKGQHLLNDFLKSKLISKTKELDPVTLSKKKKTANDDNSNLNDQYQQEDLWQLFFQQFELGRQATPTIWPKETMQIKPASLAEEKYQVRSKWSIWLSKTGPLRFLSHLDYVEMARKSFRRARLPVTMSRGFNRKEKISLPPALSLGVASLGEPFVVELYENCDLASAYWQDRLDIAFPEGCQLSQVMRYEKRFQQPSQAQYLVSLHSYLETDIVSLIFGEQGLADYLSQGVLEQVKRSANMKHGIRRKQQSPGRVVSKEIAPAIVAYQPDDSKKGFLLTMKINSPDALGITHLLNDFLAKKELKPWYHYFEVIRQKIL